MGVQEAKGYFDGILARGTAFLTGEWVEDDSTKPVDPLLAAYRGVAPVPDEKMLDALRDGSGSAGTKSLDDDYAEARAAASYGLDAYSLLGTTAGPEVAEPVAVRGTNGKSPSVPQGDEGTAEGLLEGPGRDVAWFVNQNLTERERDGVIECPIEPGKGKRDP